MHMRTMTPFARAAAALSALVMCCSLAACSSSSNSSDSSNSSTANQIAGVTATGKLGEKPSIAFNAPMTVSNGSYVVLQKGNGDTIEDGDRVCYHGIALNAKDGTELMDTWTSNVPECSLKVSESTLNSTYYNQIKGATINSTIAFGVNDGSSDGYSYLLVMTLISKSKDLEKATGTVVTDIDSKLPKVTRANDGKPSIDMNGQGKVTKLVTQTLIKGTGTKLTDSSTAVVKYTGWLLDGTQFDSSWDRDSTFDADLSSSGGIIQGWKDGLIGQTVGSQVLLIIPSSLGYGDSGSGTIPGGATLVFVVDIVAAY